MAGLNAVICCCFGTLKHWHFTTLTFVITTCSANANEGKLVLLMEVKQLKKVIWAKWLLWSQLAQSHRRTSSREGCAQACMNQRVVSSKPGASEPPISLLWSMFWQPYRRCSLLWWLASQAHPAQLHPPVAMKHVFCSHEMTSVCMYMSKGIQNKMLRVGIKQGLYRSSWQSDLNV